MSFPIEKYKTQTQLETTKIQNSFLYPHLIKAYELKKAKPHINKAQIKVSFLFNFSVQFVI